LSSLHFDRLTEAANSLYREFAAPTPPIIEGCPCCLDTRKTDVLLAKPLAELSGDDLWRYTTGAFLTVGGERDFAYLLPRIFWIAATSAGESPGAEIVIGKLKRANWRSWSQPRQDRIEEFLDAWVEYAVAQDLKALDEYDLANATEGVFCGAAIAGISPRRWFHILERVGAAPIARLLRDSLGVEDEGFWEGVPIGKKELMDFLSNQQTAD
jgi:hypothetical protein